MFCSCYADKGNYDYREINEVAIVGMPDTLVTKFKNADTLKVTPLLEDSFAENGDYMSVEYLVNAGAHLNTTDKFRKTALMYAMENGNPEVIDLLTRASLTYNK